MLNDDERILAVGRELREAAQYWKSAAKIDAEFAAWPKNKAAVRRFLDALTAWDELMDVVALSEVDAAL